MVDIMRTTVAIDDHLLASARASAHRRHQTLGALIEDALRRELSRAGVDAGRPPIPVFTAGSGPRRSLDMSSNRGLLEALDEGQELDRLR